MSKCPFCNKPNPDDARQCEHCGARLQDRPAETLPNESAGDSQPSELERELVDLLRAGRKIPAIKLCRQETGLGLKEAKDTVEELTRKHQIEQPQGGGCAGVLLLAAIVAVGLWVL